MESLPTMALDAGLNLGEILTKGSILHINENYNDDVDADIYIDSDKNACLREDFIMGRPIESFEELKGKLIPIDESGLVRKKIIEEGGGMPLHEGCTVSIAFSGYWENETEPFEVRRQDRPLVVDMKESGLLPGLQMAVESMLVGELSLFLLSYKVMYGELGVPPRIKPKADCVFYIKLVKSILTPQEGNLELDEPNMFKRVLREVKMLYASGVILFKANNFKGVIHLYRKAVYMLHKCRLANEDEEKIQEKMLVKLYINLAICYNATKQPLKACIACNELNRLDSLWSNGKVLYLNAKALRMIGAFDAAKKKLQRAKKLCPSKKEIDEELELLKKVEESNNQTKLKLEQSCRTLELVSEEFKQEINGLIKDLKEDKLNQFVLPERLNNEELNYVKEACIKENLFFNTVREALSNLSIDNLHETERSLEDQARASTSVVKSNSDVLNKSEENNNYDKEFPELTKKD